MDELGFRADVLRAHRATDGETDELLAYAENAFTRAEPLEAELPLADEPHVEAWERYARRAAAEGVVPVLRGVLPQLRFPVETGMAATDAYRAATLRGEPSAHPDGGVRLEDEDGIRLFLHPTPAGRIPVIVAERRADFVSLVPTMLYRALAGGVDLSGFRQVNETHGRVAGDEVKYNEVAARVMREANVPTNDLYAFAKPRLAEIQRPANVHFTDPGSAALAEQVAAAVERALADRKAGKGG